MHWLYLYPNFVFDLSLNSGMWLMYKFIRQNKFIYKKIILIKYQLKKKHSLAESKFKNDFITKQGIVVDW